jgi:hypothetical protein
MIVRLKENFPQMLSPREELEIGVMIAGELIELVHDGKVSTSEIRSYLRDVVSEVGIGHTDNELCDMTINRIRRDLAGRI